MPTGLESLRRRVARTIRRKRHESEMTDAQLVAALAKLFTSGRSAEDVRAAWEIQYGRRLAASDALLQEAEALAIIAEDMAGAMLALAAPACN